MARSRQAFQSAYRARTADLTWVTRPSSRASSRSSAFAAARDGLFARRRRHQRAARGRTCDPGAQTVARRGRARGPAPRSADPRRRRHSVRRRGADLLREVMLAHEHRVPVMVYAISAGPLKDPAVQAMVRDGLGRARWSRCASAAPVRCWRTSACTARSWSPRTRRSCSNPSRCRRTCSSAKAWTPDVSWSACRCASRGGGARHQRAGLSQAARRCRRLHGRSLRRRRRVRAARAEDGGRAARARRDRPDAARPARAAC